MRGSDVDLDGLAAASGTAALDVVLACALPADAAACFHRWHGSAHRLARSSLIPACAAPVEVAVVPTWPDERAAAAPAFAPVCGSCRLRSGCEGLPASWRRAAARRAGDLRAARTLGRPSLRHAPRRAGHRVAGAAGGASPRVAARPRDVARRAAGGRDRGRTRRGGTVRRGGLHVAMSAPVTLDERDHLRAGGGQVTIVYVSSDPADAQRALAIEADLAALAAGALPDVRAAATRSTVSSARSSAIRRAAWTPSSKATVIGAPAIGWPRRPSTRSALSPGASAWTRDSTSPRRYPTPVSSAITPAGSTARRRSASPRHSKP